MKDPDYFTESQTLGLTEEYIDMVSILNELYFDTEKFLEPIKEVKIHYE